MSMLVEQMKLNLGSKDSEIKTHLQQIKDLETHIKDTEHEIVASRSKSDETNKHMQFLTDTIASREQRMKDIEDELHMDLGNVKTMLTTIEAYTAQPRNKWFLFGSSETKNEMDLVKLEGKIAAVEENLAKTKVDIITKIDAKPMGEDMKLKFKEVADMMGKLTDESQKNHDTGSNKLAE